MNFSTTRMRERRATRDAQRTLERELASYTTRSDVDDLLAVISDQEGQDAERIRTILTRNLQDHSSTRLLAS